MIDWAGRGLSFGAAVERELEGLWACASTSRGPQQTRIWFAGAEDRGGRGKITFEYGSLEQFDSVVERLKR